MKTKTSVHTPDCRYGHGELKLCEADRSPYFALLGVNKDGEISFSESGLAVKLFRCPVCLYVEMQDVSEEEYAKFLRGEENGAS